MWACIHSRANRRPSSKTGMDWDKEALYSLGLLNWDTAPWSCCQPSCRCWDNAYVEVEDEVDTEESTVKMLRYVKRMTLDYLCLMHFYFFISQVCEPIVIWFFSFTLVGILFLSLTTKSSDTGKGRELGSPKSPEEKLLTLPYKDRKTEAQKENNMLKFFSLCETEVYSKPLSISTAW